MPNAINNAVWSADGVWKIGTNKESTINTINTSREQYEILPYSRVIPVTLAWIQQIKARPQPPVGLARPGCPQTGRTGAPGPGCY
jgi:hypothetical protein